MCNFCNNIIPLKEYLRIPIEDRQNQLLVLKDEIIYWKVVDTDMPQGRMVMGQINYCPRCGRRLTPYNIINSEVRW